MLFLLERDQTSRIHRLFKIPFLGGQRPLELLAKMRLLCPEYNQKGSLFREMLYERLNQLVEDNSSTVGELAARANKIAPVAATGGTHLSRSE